MGKRIISQRRGRGTRRYVALPRGIGKTKHKTLSDKEIIFGKVIDILNCRSHTAPLIVVKYDDGEEALIHANDRVAVGDIIATGKTAPVQAGNTLPLSNIPEGTSIYNIEQMPGDGGKFVKAAGTFARVAAKTGNKVVVKLPSKKDKAFNANCRATVGIVAGAGRLEKPMMKAGKKWHAKRAKGKLYPVTSAVAMNAVDHPFGSGRGRHMGKPSIAPRNAPPGRKVGQVRPRRTGKKK